MSSHTLFLFLCMFSVTKSCLTLQPHGCRPSVSSVHGISQAKILEHVAISFFRGSSWPKDWTHISCIAGGVVFCLFVCFYYWAPGKPSSYSYVYTKVTHIWRAYIRFNFTLHHFLLCNYRCHLCFTYYMSGLTLNTLHTLIIYLLRFFRWQVARRINTNQLHQ